MQLDAVMAELEAMGNPQTKKIFMNHGAREPFFGVKVGDMKTILKKAKNNHGLALALYDTGNADAMYLAGLMADKKKVTPEELDHWVDGAYWYMVSEYAVAALAAESAHGLALGMKWIEDEREHVANAGWATLGHCVSLLPDDQLDTEVLGDLLARVEQSLHQAPNRVRYTMNGFVIAVGSYVAALTERAKEVAEKIGKVSVDMGGTACKVPLATATIAKIEKMGRIGRKRKNARC